MCDYEETTKLIIDHVKKTCDPWGIDIATALDEEIQESRIGINLSE
jgi:hypothetical protein